MTFVRVTSRELGVLALLVGVVTMHAVAGGHGAHASGLGPVPAQQVTHGQDSATYAHAQVNYVHTAHENVPVHGTAGLAAQGVRTGSGFEQTGVAAPCDDGCPSHGGALTAVCLMVLSAAAFLLLASRAPIPVRRQRSVPRGLALRRAATRPLRPPSLSVLCISRT